MGELNEITICRIFWHLLVCAGAALHGLGIGLLGASFAFGFALLTMAYAMGGISRGHSNPAVSVGLGDAAGAFLLYPIATCKADMQGVGGYASNGCGDLSPGNFLRQRVQKRWRCLPKQGALSQLWLFWVAPIIGAVIGALIHKALLSDEA